MNRESRKQTRECDAFAVRSFVAFATTGTASAEVAIAAAAGTQAWSDRDRLDQDCSATMKVDYPKLNNAL